MTDPSPIGPNLKRLRLETKNPETGQPYTIARIADELGVYYRTYQKWERNESQPSWMYLQRLAEFYKTDVPALFEAKETS